MSKKLFIILMSVILAFFLITLIGYYFILQNNNDIPNESGGIFENFFPFGGNNDTPSVITKDPSVDDPVGENANYTQKLRKLSAEPVAGAGVLDVKAGSIVRHIERATGHIFETELYSPNQNRISNTTIPLVYDAVWGNRNNSLIARYLKEDNQIIDTYGLLIREVSTTTENIVSAVKFQENLTEISAFGNSVFSLEKRVDSSVGYISNFDGSRRVQIWNSPIKELLPQYINSRTIGLTTKPHQDSKGFLFIVDTGNAQTKVVLGGIFGLSTLVNDLATQILYLDQSNAPIMFVFDVKNRSSVVLTPSTFPEKCVWSKKDRNVVYCAVPEEFIDRDSLTSWYRGLLSFTDDIWKYDIKNNTSSLIQNLSAESGEQIDVIKPILSENEQYLIFINKIDNTLWSLDLAK